MELFTLALVILIVLAIADIIVGVSNDAVNFLNSSIGSHVAPRSVILAIASLGMLAGVTFSSGMMEVARKGIFHPQFFNMPELLVMFLAVMLTNLILLDLYNTYGLPTSTTVSIVFALLGAAVAVSLLKLHQEGGNLTELVNYINTGKAMTIIFGILLSVVIAFFVGAIVQFVTRMLFTFNFERKLRRYGGLWGGGALSLIVYFILLKGAGGASFLSDETLAWIQGNSSTILLASFVVCAVVLQLLLLLTRVKILKIVILIGTFALAMAFAANDLVNFIGVPLAGLSAYKIAASSGDVLHASMEALRQPVRSNTHYLLLAGAIMVVTLWLSKKSRTVTKTEISLGRQSEGYERFEASVLSQTIVRLMASLFESAGRIFPRGVRRWVDSRFDRTGVRPTPFADGTVPSFDLLRAAVNLVVASALIAFATSLKLPLSTTYVTFMVAMGTSLSDQAWGRDSAVYRVSGVLTVIGGWFFTAIMALVVSSLLAVVIYYGETPAVLGIFALAVYFIVQTHFLHKKRVQRDDAIEVFNLRKIKDSTASIIVSFEHAGIFLKKVREVLELSFSGLFANDRAKLKNARTSQKTVQLWSNIIAANVFKVLRLLQRNAVEDTHRYAMTISSLQEISESVRDIVMRSYLHVANHHSGMLEAQKAEMQRIRQCLDELLETSSQVLRRRTQPDFDYIAGKIRELRSLTHEFDQNQIMRIQDNSSKTRLSILFYSLSWDCLKLSEQISYLMTVFSEPLRLSESDSELSQE